MFRVLVVDDEPDINEVVREGLRVAGYDPVPALSGEEAFAAIGRQVPDLVLLDRMRSTNTVADGARGGCYLVGGWSPSKPRVARLKTLASSRC